jgi:hypothetical protein
LRPTTKKPEASGAKITHRKSFLATKQLLPPYQTNRSEIAELASDPLDATAIGLKVISLPNPAVATGLRLDVTVDLRESAVAAPGDHWLGSFDLGFSLDSAKPADPPSVKTINLNLTEDQMKQALTAGVVVGNNFPAPPQPARLRVVALDRRTAVPPGRYGFLSRPDKAHVKCI